MKRPLLVAVLIASAAVAVFADAPATRPAQPTTTQSQEGFEVRRQIRYLQYFPPGYAEDPTNAKDGDHGWPLVLFLHGSGQCGANLEVVKQEGLPKLIAEGRQFPFVMLSPQVGLDEYVWVSRDLVQLIDHAEQTMHVDPDRVIVTGLSMGGFGTWDLAAYAPDRLAAIVPICGGGKPRSAKWFKDLPVWAFHGDQDDAVPLSQSVAMVEALQAVGSTKAKLTVYPGVGHPSWRIAYDDPKLFEWMLAQRRQPATRPAK